MAPFLSLSLSCSNFLSYYFPGSASFFSLSLSFAWPLSLSTSLLSTNIFVSESLCTFLPFALILSLPQTLFLFILSYNIFLLPPFFSVSMFFSVSLSFFCLHLCLIMILFFIVFVFYCFCFFCLSVLAGPGALPGVGNLFSIAFNVNIAW